MAYHKTNLWLLIVAVLPVLRSQPLEEQPVQDKTVPPVAKIQENHNTSNENATDESYVEETYIEVLLPGIPQVNSSLLQSLLNSSFESTASTTENTDSNERPKRENEQKLTPLASFQAGKDSTVIPPKNQEESTKNPIRVARDVGGEKATPQQSSTSTESVVYITPQKPIK
ncbi:uncharacterized protein LOC126736055 [Anthonomus grandis grandis]|uniref:uncharacterized protein LOC126736055 n=1 Tax=Anthonomus grandis grandis TaxID=2921223 RepID=UPI002165DD8F|nr:uncharacterized protein LOC126736055 [Anthonomus grandis grandis]